jgi:hypothetical protein
MDALENIEWFMDRWEIEHAEGLRHTARKLCEGKMDFEECVKREQRNLLADAQERVEGMVEWYRKLDEGTMIPVWRRIVVEDLDDFARGLEKGFPDRGAGTSWARHKDTAIPYNAKGGAWEVLFSGEIEKGAIDVDTTAMLEIDVGDYTEDELRLLRGAEVWVNGVEIRSDSRDAFPSTLSA